MIYKINKNMLLKESFINRTIESIKSKFNFFSNKFKYLNNHEFETLLNVLYGWYYLNYKFPDDLEKKSPDVIKLFDKIKYNSKINLPLKLYRGLAFSTKKELDNFLSDIKTQNKVNGKLFRLKQDTRYTAWTSSKKLVNQFLPGGDNSEDYMYGCLLTINTKNLNMDNFTFSMNLLLDKDEDKKEFLNLILKAEYNKNLKYINNTKPKKLDPKVMFGYQHGSVFSLIEDEYILNNVPYNICDIQEIKL